MLPDFDDPISVYRFWRRGAKRRQELCRRLRWKHRNWTKTRYNYHANHRYLRLRARDLAIALSSLGGHATRPTSEQLHARAMVAFGRKRTTS